MQAYARQSLLNCSASSSPSVAPRLGRNRDEAANPERTKGRAARDVGRRRHDAAAREAREIDLVRNGEM